jgi:hypothetical protein
MVQSGFTDTHFSEHLTPSIRIIADPIEPLMVRGGPGGGRFFSWAEWQENVGNAVQAAVFKTAYASRPDPIAVP